MVMWWMLAVVAQAAQVLLKVQPTELVEGQSGRAQLLVVSNTVGRRSLRLARVPIVESNDGLSIGFDGQSSEFQVINGQITQILSFGYRVTALREGTWKVGPVEVILDDGSRTVTKAVDVRVTTREDAEERPDVVVESRFDTERAYEGQLVLYEFRLESRNPDATVEWLFPDFEGLRQPQEGNGDLREYPIEDPEGTIVVSEGAVPLIATGTGTRTYEPAVANVKTPIGTRRRMMFLQRIRNDPWATRPTELTVVPLPPPPPDFTGLVGDFELTSRLAQRRAEVGQSIDWMVGISGDGVLEGFTLPAYSAPGAAVYDEDPHVVADVEQGAWRSSATFRRALVPTEAGSLQPPPLRLVTFSPTREEYVTHEIALPTIVVTPGREGTGEVTSFAPEEGPEVAVDVDMAPRPILRSGRAVAWRLTGWLPVMLGLTALPGIALWLRELGGWAHEWWQARQKPVEVERTAAEVVAAAPRDPEGRAAAYETALRLAIDERPDDEELQAIFRDFLRARFGEGRVPRDLEVRIEQAVKPQQDVP